MTDHVSVKFNLQKTPLLKKSIFYMWKTTSQFKTNLILDPVNHANVAAQLQLGLCYYLGKGVTKNLREAINVFHLIAKQGNADAQYYLGICHLDSVNVVEAVKWLRLSVKNRHSGAQYRLGMCCLNGLGIERNEVEAFRLLTLSSSQGNEDAQYQLGMCHLNGIGVQANLIESVKWFRQASDKGHVEARYQMGVCFFNRLDVENNVELARKWFQLSRNSESLYYLGLCSCIENDFATAAKYFRVSAEKGNALAQYRFGLCYYKGRGVKKDPLDAFKWFHMSATQGNDSAQYWLGMCYYNGHGVQKDLKEAVKWLELSAKQSNESAQYQLGIWFMNENKIEAAVKCFTLSAHKGKSEAQHKLGELHYRGVFFDKNLDQAIKFFHLAALQGHRGAKRGLALCWYNLAQPLPICHESTEYLSECPRQLCQNSGTCWRAKESLKVATMWFYFSLRGSDLVKLVHWRNQRSITASAVITHGSLMSSIQKHFDIL
ncbi:HCP-like protein [Rhizoclosmatium globosum]|uniref:HCP-like protein n=1 Tax=Rhizoclosmatium globosum TaxID=329046 RepID=A0A1Y2BS78_9FUNG|nr:HCP-like protein [Rhizoclosmatium globosum]|eukprot:ORY37593.1 HCP-like protein [Rhizoclosmatium globosum]